MSSIAISAIAFALVFGGALLGALLGARLPKHHLIDENKEVVRLAMALVGTLTGMALGLLIGSAKTYYDTQSNELTQVSANVALLGHLLQYYGPEANEAQESLRLAVERVLVENWPNQRAETHFRAEIGINLTLIDLLVGEKEFGRWDCECANCFLLWNNDRT